MTDHMTEEKQESPHFGNRLAAHIARLPLAGKVAGWLLTFAVICYVGLPPLYSAALTAAPWLLLTE